MCHMVVLLCSHHATAVSAGAATAGVRGGVGVCYCAASVITFVNVAVAKSGSWKTYIANDHRPAFLKPLTASGRMPILCTPH